MQAWQSWWVYSLAAMIITGTSATRARHAFANELQDQSKGLRLLLTGLNNKSRNAEKVSFGVLLKMFVY